jgi:hypothetical protein
VFVALTVRNWVETNENTFFSGTEKPDRAININARKTYRTIPCFLYEIARAVSSAMARPVIRTVMAVMTHPVIRNGSCSKLSVIVCTGQLYMSPT